MDAAATGRGRLAAQCRKHAFAPPTRFRPRNGVPETTVLPAQRPDRRPWRAELASGSSVAGDDPVDKIDPTGQYLGESEWNEFAADLQCGLSGGASCPGSSAAPVTAGCGENPFSSNSCFKRGWDSMSGRAQLADATLPITMPLTVVAFVTGVGEAGVATGLSLAPIVHENSRGRTRTIDRCPPGVY